MRQTLGTFVVAALTLCLVSSNPRSAAADTALGSSKWSLEVGTNLGSGNGEYSFAIRRHSGASSAFRFGVESDLYDSDGDGQRTVTGSPDADAEMVSYNGTHSFSIQWMRFASIRDNVTATFGVGPVLQVNRSGGRQEYDAGLPTFNGYEYTYNETVYGLDARLGAEWFFNNRVSLGAQTGLRATTGTGNTRQINRSGTGVTYSKTETDIDSDVTRISTRNARILLSVYF